MPGFHLTPTEALSLTLYLQTQKTVTHPSPPWPKEILNPPPRTTPVSKADFKAELAKDLICLTCHNLDGTGGQRAVELSTIGHRLNPTFIKQYLVNPATFGVDLSLMPPQFFTLPEGSNDYKPIHSHSARQVHLLADFLSSQNPEKQQEQKLALEQAIKDHPQASVATGKRLFIALNCTACHRHPTIKPRPAAPSLASQGLKVKPAWLQQFLRQPHPIRPFGIHAGDGGRMPDFNLTEEESAHLTAFLMTQIKPLPDVTHFNFKPLSTFSKNKAANLLTNKLSCLGCHQFGTMGGRIGPDLSAVGERLQPNYIHTIVTKPRITAPHTIMPRIAMPKKTENLIINFLAQSDGKKRSNPYLSVTDHPTINPSRSISSDTIVTNSTQLYLKNCAPCHGARGQGDGFNASFINSLPSKHADQAHTSTIPDDTLFDGIHAGGAILNKSHLMPAWGRTLNPTQIKTLVQHIRNLCQCNGPPWSRPKVTP
jgi:mono/diheme cytochrome c family protein